MITENSQCDDASEKNLLFLNTSRIHIATSDFYNSVCNMTSFLQNL